VFIAAKAATMEFARMSAALRRADVPVTMRVVGARTIQQV